MVALSGESAIPLKFSLLNRHLAFFTRVGNDSKTWLYFCLITSLIISAVSSLEYTPVISTRYGQLRGIYQHVPGSGRVATYLGIPYATPPMGPNRLSPTRAPSQWKGILDASVLPPACPQNPPEKYRHLLQRQSEDCLYLNLYVPGKTKLNRLTK